MTRAWPLVVCMLLAIAVPVPAQAPDSPLAAAPIDITGPTPQWVFGEPTDTTISVEITNTANRPSSSYIVRYQWEAQGTRTPLNEDRESSFDVGGPLAGGASHTHTAPWRLQPHQRGEGAIVVQIEESSKVERHNDVFVAERAFSSQIPGPEITLGPDGTAFFRIQVSNDGNVADQYALQLEDDDPRLEEELAPAVIAVGAGQTGEARLSMHYAFTGNVEDFATTYDVTLLPEFIPGKSQAITTPEVRIDNALPAPGRQESLVPTASTTTYGAPDEAMQVTFRLTNQGESQEGYTFAPLADNGWTSPQILRGGTTLQRVVLDSGEGIEFDAVATAPSGPAGIPGAVGVSVAPDRGGEALESWAELRIHGPAPVIVSHELHSPGPYLDDPMTLQVRVENAGDEAMEEATSATAVATFSDGSTESLQEELPLLMSGAGHLIEFQFEEVPAIGEITVDMAVDADPSQGVWRQTETAREASLTVHAPEPLHGVPGEAVRYHSEPSIFTIENEGDGVETIQLTASAEAGSAQIIGPTEVTLVPGQKWHAAVTHTIPSAPGLLQVDELVLAAAIHDAPHHSASATTETEIRDNNAPLVLFEHTLPARWAPDAGLEVLARTTDETAVTDAWLRIEDATGSQDESMHAQAGLWTTVISLPAGEYNLRVEATDAHGNIGKSSNHTLTIDPHPPPEILDVEVRGNASPPYVTGRVQSVEDITLVTITIDDEDPQDLAITNGRFNETLELAPGTYEIVIEVTDAGQRSAAHTATITVPEPETEEIHDPGVDKESPGPGLLIIGGLLWFALLRRRG